MPLSIIYLILIIYLSYTNLFILY